MPCFRTFIRAFWASHSKSISCVQSYTTQTEVSRLMRPAGYRPGRTETQVIAIPIQTMNAALATGR